MRKKVTAFLLIFWLLILIISAIKFDTVQANAIPLFPLPEQLATEHGYIRVNGTVDPPTLPIERQGNVYRLTDNIINCTFEVESDNIIIDGNGFLLSVPAFGELDKNYQVKGAYPLISISNKSNILVKNITFDKYSTAVDIRNSSNIIIFQNTVRNGSTGIYMVRSANCNLLANDINSNSVYGVLIQDCTSMNISYNEISHNGYAGIEVDDLTRRIFDGMKNSNFTRNTFSDHDHTGLYFLGDHSNNSVFENNFLNNMYGVLFMATASVNNSIFNNYWKGNQVQINDFMIDKYDPSPLKSQISTEFNQSLLILPSFNPTPSPTSLLGFNETFYLTVIVIVTILVVVMTIGLFACSRGTNIKTLFSLFRLQTYLLKAYN